ncbi:DUF6603 domain-containing protein [Fibrobacter sp.]|uniref:DUF6603 domain-containing protein n=1 Tax=Fibrobacter sp. TaxID=35828 RepID=UPI00388E947F
MANEESSQKQGENLSSVTYFVEKLATVFSRVKDCVLQDLLDELIKEGATWEDFQKELDQVKDNSIDKNIGDFKVFVDRIVKKLGYDISAAETECGELYNVLAQLVVSGEKLGVAFKKLFKEYEDKDPQKVLEDLISGIKVTPNESKDGKNATLVTWSDVKESFGSLDNFCKEAKKIGDSDTILIGTEKFNIGLAAEGSDYGKIMPILNLVQEILDLIKKFSDIEWGKIKDEFEDFGNFIYDSYFTEEFGKRILDYILILILKNAKDVFREDLDAIWDELKVYKKQIGQDLKSLEKKLDGPLNAVVEFIKKISGDKEVKQILEFLDDVIDLRDEIDELKSGLEKELTEALNAAESEISSAQDAIESEIKDLAKQAEKSPTGAIEDLPDTAEKFGETIKDSTSKVGNVIENSTSNIADKLEETGTHLKDNAEKYISSEIDDIQNKINEARDRIKKEIEDRVKEEISRRVQAAIKVAEEKIKELIKEFIPQYDSLARVFHKIYAVLEFVGIIGEEKVKLATYIPNKVDNNDGGVLDPIKSIEIPSFDWKALAQIFTSPKSYLEDKFPLNDCNDIEKLIVKVSNLLNAFDCNIPKITSVKDFLWELVARVEAEIKKNATNGTNDFIESLKTLRAYIYTTLIALEDIALETKKQLAFELDNAVKQGESLVNDLKSKIGGELENIEKNVNNRLNDLKNTVVTNVGSIDQESAFYQIFIETLGEAAQEEISASFNGVKLNKDVTLKHCNDSVKKSVESLRENSKNLISKIEDFLDKDKWERCFNVTVIKLKTEFEIQTAGIPKNKEEVEKAIANCIDDLLGGDSPENPFAGIDFSKYYEIVAEAVEDRLPKDLDKEFENIENVLNEAIKELTTAICKDVEKLRENAEGNVDAIVKYSEGIPQLACNILNAWLEKVKEKFYEIIIKPIISQIRKAIKVWFGEILSKVLEVVKNSLREILKNSELKKILNNAEDVINAVVGMIPEILKLVNDVNVLVDEAKKVDTWKSGFLFAVKVIKAIPEVIKAIPDEIKDKVFEVCKLPKLPACLENFKLPDYKFDAENNILIVNIWTKKVSDNSGDATGNADVCIQLALFAGEITVNNEKHDGLYIVPMVTGSLGSVIGIGKNHTLQLGAYASLNKDGVSNKTDLDGTTSIFIDVDESFKKNPISVTGSKESVSAKASLTFGRKEGVDPLSFFDTDIASLSIGNYSLSTGVAYNKKVKDDSEHKGFDFGVEGSLENLVLTLKLRNQNDFFEKILKDDIAIKLSKLDVGYSLSDGFNIDGGLYVNIPINSDIDLKFVKFNNISLEIGGEKGNLIANLLTTFVVDLEGVVITFPEMGLGIKCNVLDSNFKPGSFKISPKFKFPSGLGISIDVEAVKGSGFVDWNEEKGRFFGQVELTILDKCGASGRILFTTGKNNTPYSFSGALSVFFTPGIQLGMGFSLTAIGGSLGVNRGLNIDKLRDAVYDGTLTSVLLTKNIDKDIDKILANIDAYYPIHEGQMYFGFLGQITWGEILKADFGLFVQAPSPVAIIIAGNVAVKIENETAKKLIAINASFMGGYQSDKGIFFDAHLYDSHIVGIDLYGDVALRIYWAGDTKGFILSAGGFHPQYKPESGFNLPDMKRMGMKLDYDILKMSLEAYFAITSNTVQFGTDFQMRIGWDKFGISGYAGFNALFQFHPFKFVVDMSAGLAVKVGSCTICSISLDFELGGPAQWHAKGTASFWVLFIKIKVSFNLTWGKKQIDDNRSRIDVLPLYTNAFNDRNNWKFISTDLVDNMVSMVEFDRNDFVMQPSENIEFNQSAVPFYKKMDCYGEDNVNDCNFLAVKEILVGGETVEYDSETNSFAPSLVNRLSEKEKLSKPSYEDMYSGFLIKTNSGEKASSSVNICFEEEPKVCEDKFGKSNKEFWKSYCSSDSNKSSSASTSQNTQKSSATTMRAALRRTAAGFDRYIKQTDQMLANDYKSLVSKHSKNV